MLLLALYVIPWCSQPVARVTGIQLYTLVIAVWGVYVLLDVNNRLAGREPSLMRDRTGGKSAVLRVVPGG